MRHLRYDLIFALGIALLLLGWFAGQEARDAKATLYKDAVTKHVAENWSLSKIERYARATLKDTNLAEATLELQRAKTEYKRLAGDDTYDWTAGLIPEGDQDADEHSDPALGAARERLDEAYSKRKEIERSTSTLALIRRWRAWNWSSRALSVVGATLAAFALYRLLDGRSRAQDDKMGGASGAMPSP